MRLIYSIAVLLAWSVASPAAEYSEQPDERLAMQVRASATALERAPGVHHELLTSIVREAIPHEYEDATRWGHTTSERINGLTWRFDRGRPEVRAQRREVNHGTWERFKLKLLDPDERLRLQLDDIRHDETSGALAFTLTVEASVEVEARRAEWVKGVQLYNISTTARADVRLAIDCRVQMVLETKGKIVPDVLLKPTVDDARLQVANYRVLNVSKIGGEVAQLLGRATESFVERAIEKQEAKLPEKINKQIAKRQEKLRFSLSQFAGSQWQDLSKLATPEKM